MKQFFKINEISKLYNIGPHPNGTTAQLRAAFEAGALSLPNSNYIVEAEKSGASLS